MAHALLGALLKQAGLIDDMQLNAGLAHQKQWGGRLGEVLLGKGFVDELGLFEVLAQQHGVQLVSIAPLGISRELIQAFPLQLAQRHLIFPLKVSNKVIVLATDNPGNVQALDEVTFQLRMKLHVVMARSREIEWAIRRYYHGDPSPCPPPQARMHVPEAEDMKLTDAAGSTLVKGVDQLRAEHQARGGGAPAAHPPGMTAMSPDAFHALAQSVEGLQQVVRFLLEMSMQKGVFTREEYMAFIEELRRQR